MDKVIHAIASAEMERILTSLKISQGPALAYLRK